MLTLDQVEAYRKHGYVIVPDFINKREVDAYAKEAETLTNHCYEHGDIVAKWGCVVEPLGCGYLDKHEIPQAAKTSRAEYLRARAQISSQPTPALCTLDKFGACARQLLLQHTDSNTVVLLNEQYVVKPPRAQAEFAWHQDVLYFSGTQRQHAIVSVWTPLCDVCTANGTVLIDPFPDPDRPGDYDARILQRPTVAAEMAAGSALFMDGRLRHCSTANTTGEFRTVYMPQFSLGQITAGNDLAALAVPID
ncbi:hypothetical protein IWW50_000416 [Coemansia erecta]|nr:hypothetical protein GGF43_000201 [Coemansia sp. RSA 2618]KAJ2830215.1 hypothetical protein IWW50_000416 [Coemansia erecta]